MKPKNRAIEPNPPKPWSSRRCHRTTRKTARSNPIAGAAERTGVEAIPDSVDVEKPLSHAIEANRIQRCNTLSTSMLHAYATRANEPNPLAAPMGFRPGRRRRIEWVVRGGMATIEPNSGMARGRRWPPETATIEPNFGGGHGLPPKAIGLVRRAGASLHLALYGWISEAAGAGPGWNLS